MAADDTEMCDACNGSGFGVADTYCGKCGGAGGYPMTTPSNPYAGLIERLKLAAGRAGWCADAFENHEDSDGGPSGIHAEAAGEATEDAQSITDAIEALSRLTRDVEEAKEALAAFKDAARLPQGVAFHSKRVTVPASIYHQIDATLTGLSRMDIKEKAK